ncbi:MAG: crossover junction endodeoxyribonuclease RuvC [Candidatus Eremiobacterota bacterium]
MIVMGVDPGLITTGYGLLQEHGQKITLIEGGVVKTRSCDELSVRLKVLFNGISGVLDEFRPDAVAVEKLYSHYKHPKTAIMMGHARGVIYLAAAIRDIPVASYGATEIKQSITGRGRATKEQVQFMMSRELGLQVLPEPYDVTDALGIALTHINMRKKEIFKS